MSKLRKPQKIRARPKYPCETGEPRQRRVGNQHYSPNETRFNPPSNYPEGYQKLSRIPPIQPGDTVEIRPPKNPNPNSKTNTTTIPNDDPLNGQKLKVIGIRAYSNVRFAPIKWQIVLEGGRCIDWSRCKRINVFSSEDEPKNND